MGPHRNRKENRVKQFYAELGFSAVFYELAQNPEAYYQSFWKNLTYYFISESAISPTAVY